MILLDANVLVYAIDTDSPRHLASRAVVQAAFDGRLPAVLVPQVLLEFLAVATHPRRVRHPLGPALAWEQVLALRARLPVLELQQGALTVLGELLAAHPTIGSDIFDLFLIAQMRTHRITTVCTYNGPDFARAPGVEALTAEELLARYALRQDG